MNFIDLIPRFVLLAAIVALGSLAGVQTWRLAGAKSEIIEAQRDLGHAKDNVHTLELAVSEGNTKAEKQAKDFQRQVTEATNAAKTREIVLRRDADAAHASADSLRDDLITLRHGFATASIDALRERSDTLAELFGQCSERYRSVAEKADRHASDVKMLQEAWPR